MNLLINISNMPNIIIKNSDENIIKSLKVNDIILKKEKKNITNLNQDLLSNTFINNILPITYIDNIEYLKKSIENYIEHNIYDIEPITYKILELTFNEKLYNVYLSGKVNGYIINNKKKILIKIIKKKKFSSLNYYEKIKFELYLRAYNLNKIACIEICNGKIFPVYYEANNDLYNKIKIKLEEIILNFLKKS